MDQLPTSSKKNPTVEKYEKLKREVKLLQAQVAERERSRLSKVSEINNPVMDQVPTSSKKNPTVEKHEKLKREVAILRTQVAERERSQSTKESVASNQGLHPFSRSYWIDEDFEKNIMRKLPTDAESEAVELAQSISITEEILDIEIFAEKCELKRKFNDTSMEWFITGITFDMPWSATVIITYCPCTKRTYIEQLKIKLCADSSAHSEIKELLQECELHCDLQQMVNGFKQYAQLCLERNSVVQWLVSTYPDNIHVNEHEATIVIGNIEDEISVLQITWSITYNSVSLTMNREFTTNILDHDEFVLAHADLLGDLQHSSSTSELQAAWEQLMIVTMQYLGNSIVILGD